MKYVLAIALTLVIFTPSAKAQDSCVSNYERDGTPALIAEGACALETLEGTLDDLTQAGMERLLDWLWPNFNFATYDPDGMDDIGYDWLYCENCTESRPD